MKASLRNIRISPKKLNLVAELVRGETVDQAVKMLTFTPKRGAKYLKKLISSAVANAENNFKQSAKNLIIKEIKVSKSFTLKRGVSGSRGRVEPMLKRTSHAHVYLEASMAAPVTKPTKKSETVKEETPSTEETKKVAAKKPAAKKTTTKKTK